MALTTEGVGETYRHYKFYHFFAICFSLGCGLLSFRPYYFISSVILGVGFLFVFEIAGLFLYLPAHTKTCKGKPYDERDVLWGFCAALLTAFLHLDVAYGCTLSHGCGLIVFALRGVVRKYNSLWEKRIHSYQG